MPGADPLNALQIIWIQVKAQRWYVWLPVGAAAAALALAGGLCCRRHCACRAPARDSAAGAPAAGVDAVSATAASEGAALGAAAGLAAAGAGAAGLVASHVTNIYIYGKASASRAGGCLPPSLCLRMLPETWSGAWVLA